MAQARGVSPEAMIKLWIREKIKAITENPPAELNMPSGRDDLPPA